jgi:GTP-binding protein
LFCHCASRHIERTRVLVYVIDITAVPVRRAGYTEILSARQQLAMLKSELSAYDPALLDKPSVVAANKVDAMGDRGAAELVAIRRAAAPWPVVPISGLRRTGIDELAAVLRAHVSSH